MNIKSKKKSEAAKFEISLNFDNNLFQTFLLEIFSSLNIDLEVESMSAQDEPEYKLSNLIRIQFKEEINFLVFFGKRIQTDLNANNLLQLIEKLLKITKPNLITIIFFETNQETFREKNDLIFFMNTKLKVKTYDSNLNSELTEFISNYSESITKKEEKSKLTFYEAKPVTSTNLCALESITDDATLIWIKHLMCIPGISELKAISVAKKYPKFKNLMDIYTSNQYSEKEKESFLKDIEVENKAKSTTAKLGKALSAKIFKVFTDLDPEAVVS